MPFHEFISGSSDWTTVADETLFANAHLEVHRLSLTSPSRPKVFEWTVAYRKGAVVVVPRTATGGYLLVRQERAPVRASLWEFPAGQIDESAKHDLAAIHGAGLRELREESGYELAPGGALVSLGHFFSSPGFTDEHSHLLLARPVVPSPRGSQHDENEAISECRIFAPVELKAMIAAGEICDANTQVAFARLIAMGLF